jgi:hypothetical protein
VVRGVAMLVVAAGCAHSSSVECGDLICSRDAVCVHDACVDPGQLAACVDHVAGDVCDFSDDLGICVDDVCVAAVASWVRWDNPWVGRNGHVSAFDSDRGVLVVLGGQNAAGPVDDYWERFDDGKLARTLGQDAPPGLLPRVGAVMTYSKLRRKIVLFGGQRDGNLLGDTWELDANGWTLVTENGPRHHARQRLPRRPLVAPVHADAVTFTVCSPGRARRRGRRRPRHRRGRSARRESASGTPAARYHRRSR